MTTAAPNANYAVITGWDDTTVAAQTIAAGKTRTTTSFPINSNNSSTGAARDVSYICAAIFA
jgi:hypothetical protein